MSILLPRIVGQSLGLINCGLRFRTYRKKFRYPLNDSHSMGTLDLNLKKMLE